MEMVVLLSKFSVGSVAGMWIFAVSSPGFGAILLVLVAGVFMGKVIAADNTLLWAYIIGAAFTGYILPILMGIGKKSWLVFLGWALTVNVVLAFPSSFVAHGGCKAGREEAILAIKAVPVVSAGFLSAKILSGTTPEFNCAYWAGPSGTE